MTIALAVEALPILNGKMPRVLALDLSLRSTGYASTLGNSGVLVPPKSIAAAGGMRRLQWIRFMVLDLAHNAADLVVIEGYAFGAENQAHQMGELGGVVRIALTDRNIPYVDVQPASLKKFATGKGNAKKDVVFGAAIRKLGYTGVSHDEADALWLLEMARTHFAGDASNDKQREALAAVAWPSNIPPRPS